MELQMAPLVRQQVGRCRETLGSRCPRRLQQRPILIVDDPVRRIVKTPRGMGNGLQQLGIVDAGETGDAGGHGEAAEAQVGNRQGRGVVGGKKRAQRRIASALRPLQLCTMPTLCEFVCASTPLMTSMREWYFSKNAELCAKGA